MSSLLDDLPDLAVTPGPASAAPLDPDRPVRWGFLSTGRMAHSFASALALLPDAPIAAVGSRRVEDARSFAAEFGAAAAYGSYEELVADPDVDIVYVATPHSLHKENTLLALEAGKPVLCEKSLTLNAKDAEDLVAVARDRGLFLMEAMWMRCNPVLRRIQQLLAADRLGTIHQVRADLGFRVDAPSTSRLFDPELGGGALLDMGVYPLTLAHVLLGEPDRLEAVAALAPSGIDLDLAVGLAYDRGAVASITTTMTSWSPRTASIATSTGRIDIEAPFHHPAAATWFGGDVDGGGEVRVEIAENLIGTGLAHEAIEVMRCLRNGETESPLVPLDDTVAILRLMDRIREQVGVRYAADVSSK